MRRDHTEGFVVKFGCLIRRTTLSDGEHYDQRCLGRDYERIVEAIDRLGRTRFHIRSIRERTGLPWVETHVALGFLEHTGVIAPAFWNRYRAVSPEAYSEAMQHLTTLAAQTEVWR